MLIRKATKDDCRPIAELALMAGEGIPAYFWSRAKRTPDEDILDVGARAAASETENFSYRNMWLALIDDEIAGMLLAYRLPQATDINLNEVPAFIRPLLELEQCAPDSFYINMVATYPRFRRQGVGTALMRRVDEFASMAQCTLISIQVFEENASAVRLYQSLGYGEIERRAVIPHECHPYHGDVLLLTRSVAST